MRNAFLSGVVCIYLGLALLGCGGPAHGSERHTLTAGQTVKVAGGKGNLYFGGYPSGLRLTLKCDGHEYSIGEQIAGLDTMLGVSESGPSRSAGACGIIVKLVSEGKSPPSNDTATFLVTW